MKIKFNRLLALVANMFAKSTSFDSGITIMAKGSSLTFDESCICQFTIAFLATEAAWMPVGIHRFNHSTNNKFTTFSTARSKEHMKIMFAVLAAFKFIKSAFWKRSETLGTPA